jgi:hypothetical protein
LRSGSGGQGRAAVVVEAGGRHGAMAARAAYRPQAAAGCRLKLPSGGAPGAAHPARAAGQRAVCQSPRRAAQRPLSESAASRRPASAAPQPAWSSVRLGWCTRRRPGGRGVAARSVASAGWPCAVDAAAGSGLPVARALSPPPCPARPAAGAHLADEDLIRSRSGWRRRGQRWVRRRVARRERRQRERCRDQRRQPARGS